MFVKADVSKVTDVEKTIRSTVEKMASLTFYSTQRRHSYIEKALYGEGWDTDFISRGTRSDKGARALIEAGFEYVLTTPNGTMLFRKRK